MAKAAVFSKLLPLTATDPSHPCFQATEQFVSDILRESLGIAYQSTPHNRYNSILFLISIIDLKTIIAKDGDEQELMEDKVLS